MQKYLGSEGYTPSDAIHSARTGGAEAQSLVNAIIRDLRLPNGPPAPRIEVCIFESGKMHAHVTQLEGAASYGILIAEGVALLLRDTFYRLLSDRRNFLEVGDPGQEIISSPSIRNLYTCADELIAYGLEGEYSIPVPRCVIRQRYADLLTRLGVLAIALHEVGHVVQGHLQLVNGQSLSNLDHRALEASADRYAASKMLQCFFAAAREERNAEFLRDERTGVTAIFRTMFIVHLFEEAASFETRLPVQDRRHPLPRHRQLMIAHAARVALERIEGENGAAASAITPVLGDVGHAYRRIVKSTGDIEYVVKCFRGDIADENLLRHWQVELRPTLVEFAYTDLPTAGPDVGSVYE